MTWAPPGSIRKTSEPTESHPVENAGEGSRRTQNDPVKPQVRDVSARDTRASEGGDGAAPKKAPGQPGL